MRYSTLPILGVLLLGVACSPRSPTRGKTLVWADEFDTAGLPDAGRWDYAVGGGGYGNHELQFYREGESRNARVEDGHLVIEAHREPHEGSAYTSARMTTSGLASWTYGYIEARAKLPTGRGTWPAIWMLGANIDAVGWPLCGEIDIMEHVGYERDSVYGTVHTQAFNHRLGTQVGKAIAVPTAEVDWHTYAVDWNAERIVFLVDGKPYHRFDKRAGATAAEWPFDAPQYLLLNQAVGGDWGGQRGVDSTIYPQRLEVDWVRVWQ